MTELSLPTQNAHFTLRFTIDSLPPITSNGSFGHWSTHSKKMRHWRNQTVFAIGRNKPQQPLEKAFVTFIRHSTREPDDDNLIISFKPVRDGLKDAGVIIDDDRKRLHARYKWQKAGAGKGFIEVIIESMQWGDL